MTHRRSLCHTSTVPCHRTIIRLNQTITRDRILNSEFQDSHVAVMTDMTRVMRRCHETDLDVSWAKKILHSDYLSLMY
jgi:hypothetical protein